MPSGGHAFHVASSLTMLCDCNPGAPRRRAALVADDAQRPAGQDWRHDRPAPALCHVPDGRARNPKRPVLRHPAPHRSAQTETTSHMTRERRFIPRRDKTGASATRHEQQYRLQLRSLGSQSHGIALLVIAIRVWIAFRAVLHQSLSCWGTHMGNPSLEPREPARFSAPTEAINCSNTSYGCAPTTPWPPVTKVGTPVTP